MVDTEVEATIERITTTLQATLEPEQWYAVGLALLSIGLAYMPPVQRDALLTAWPKRPENATERLEGVGCGPAAPRMRLN
jgi:hypothetical protein